MDLSKNQYIVIGFILIVIFSWIAHSGYNAGMNSTPTFLIPSSNNPVAPALSKAEPEKAQNITPQKADISASSSTDSLNGGIYTVGGKQYTYSYKREGKQTAFVWEPHFPDNGTIVFDAVRHTIDVAYGKKTLISPDFQQVNVNGTNLMKFSAKGRYVLVLLVKDMANGRVNAWSMFESPS